MNAMTRKTRGKPVSVEYREISNPTPERMKKDDATLHVVGGSEREGRLIITIKGAPLDRIFARKAITGREYAALQKYKHHWYHAGLEYRLSSVDLNRIFSNDPGSMSGMAASEQQAFHRKLYREARELIGHQPGIVVDNVICNEHSLEVGGHSIGYASPYRARQKALELIKGAADKLERHWGIG